MKKLNKKGQLDLKGMAVKYIMAFLFVVVVVVALSQIGIIGKITPAGGLIEGDDAGHITRAAVGTEPQEETAEQQAEINQSVEEENT